MHKAADVRRILDGDNQSDYWDGTPPLGGDSFDGR
jgi:hypothetical protein